MEPVAGDLAGQDLLRRQPRLDRLHLLDGEGGGARGRDRPAGEAQRDPDDAEDDRPPEHPVAVAGGDPRDAHQREHRDGEQPDEDHDDGGDGDVRARPADRVAQRLHADPHVGRVGDGVERPVEGRDEPHVEELHHHEQRKDCSGDAGQHAARPGRQQHGQHEDDEQLEGQSDERGDVELAQLVRRDQGGPHQEQRDDRQRHGETGVQRRALRGPAAPQPPHALADGRRERDERGEEDRLHGRTGEDVGGGHREHDALRRRDDLAPAARWERRPHPRKQPLAEQEQVARRPDREHPRPEDGGDVDAEREDEERVDLAVEPRAQRGHRVRAPSDPAVEEIQRERDGGERHEQRDGRVAPERVRDERGDADGEGGPGERHPRRALPRTRSSRDPARKCRRHGGRAHEADDPACVVEPDGPCQGREQQHLGDEPDRRARLHGGPQELRAWNGHVHADACEAPLLPGEAGPT